MRNKDNKEVFKEFISRIGVKVSWDLVDRVVISNANILRPVKGHAFEVLFDEVVHKYLECEINSGPTGDTDIDRIIKTPRGEHTLQLKTCAKNTIVKNIRLGVSLHKTHGDETRPRNLYPTQWPCPYCEHNGEEFPDFLAILHPQEGILIVPKMSIPESGTHRGHYADPAVFDWDSKFTNRWDLLGFPQFKGQSLERRSVGAQEKLPRIAGIVNLTDYEIVSMWLKPENFRTLEMNLKGNLREPAIAEWLKESGIDSRIPTNEPYPKYDRITSNGTRIQIKGPSKSLCDKKRNTVGVEVMGSHRRGADRMYSEDDFDYLGFVLDPQVIPNSVKLNKAEYHFCLIPLSELPLHYKNTEWGTTDRIYPCCKFVFDCNDKGYFLRPSKNYRIKVCFRGRGPWYVNKVSNNL